MNTYYFSVVKSGGTAVERSYLEIFPPAGVSVAVKRIRITDPNTTAATSDSTLRIRVYRTSTASSSLTTVTPVELRPESPAAVSTCGVMNAVSNVPGTIVETVFDTAIILQGGQFEWLARDYNDVLWSGENQRLCLTLQLSAVISASPGHCAEWEFIE